MRFQQLAWVLFILAVFMAAVWLFRPPRVKIASYLYSSVDQSEANASEDFDRAMEALSIVKSGEFIASIITNPTIAQTELVKGLDSPAQWLQNHLVVDFDKSIGVPTFAIIVPASQEQDGKAIVECIAQEYTLHHLAAESRSAERRRNAMTAEFQNLSQQLKKYIEVARDNSDDATDAELSEEMQQVQRKLADLSRDLESLDMESEIPAHIRIQHCTTVTRLGRW